MMTGDASALFNTKPQVFTHNMILAGIPLESALTSVCLLMNAYGIVHDIGFNSDIDTNTLETGNANIDAQNMAKYFEFKNFIDDLNREFSYMKCTAVCNSRMIRLSFICH